MTYLLDTNCCVAHLRGIRPRVTKKLETHGPAEVSICSVVKAELIFGACRSRRVVESIEKLNVFFSRFVSLPFDDTAAEAYGEIRTALTNAGTPIGPNDLMIASIARANGLILVTHNTGEFGRVAGLTVEDWEMVS